MINTGQIQIKVLTTLPFCLSWISGLMWQQLKIENMYSVENGYFSSTEDLELGNTPQEINQLNTFSYRILPTLSSCYLLQLRLLLNKIGI